MNVLFIYPNLTGQLQTPLGITSLSAVLKSAGHETMLFDTTWGYDKEGLFRAIKEFKPKLICFSTRNSDYKFSLSIAQELKKNFKTPIIFGGPHATLNPEKLIMEDCIDFVNVGEGDESLPELVQKLEEMKGTSKIRNIWAKKNGKVFQNQVRPLLQNLDELPFPDLDILDKKHLGFEILFMTSRGCPYHCTYCANHAFQKVFAGKGRYIRYKSPRYVIEEIKAAQKKIGMKSLTFVDEMFTVDKKRVKEICRLYKKEIGLPFMIETRADGVDKELLKVLKDSGCDTIAMGIEHGNEYIRGQIMKRNMKREAITQAFKMAKEVGLKTYAMNMVGLPFETEKTIFETIELNRQCRPDAIQVSIFSPYEGTELHEMCAKNGWIREEPSSNYYTHTTLELPTISSASVDSFHKTFMLYYYSPKALYPFIHAVRFCLERLPRKGRDAMGQPIFRFGQLVGLVKRYGFYTTFKSMVMPHLIKN